MITQYFMNFANLYLDSKQIPENAERADGLYFDIAYESKTYTFSFYSVENTTKVVNSTVPLQPTTRVWNNLANINYAPNLGLGLSYILSIVRLDTQDTIASMEYLNLYHADR